jgi:hypothetical protein
MHIRQSGAAHVPIMFFLILLVMFLGTLGFAYVTLTKNGELTKKIATAEADAKALRSKEVLYQHYIEDLGQVIDKPGKYEGRANYAIGYDGQTLDGTVGVCNPINVKKILDDACGRAGVSVGRGLENVLGSMVSKVEHTMQRAKDAEGERDKAMTEKSEVDRKFQEAARETANQARSWNQTLEQVRSDFVNASATKDTTIAALQQNVNDKATQLSETKEAAAAREKELTKEIGNLTMHNSALTSRERLRNPVDVADGKVLVARQGIPTAFIGLGRKDLLQPGTIFRVRNPQSEAVKAYATVVRVEDERAEVELSGIVDPVGDFVREGDLIYNELYTPRLSRTIYLMGRFSHPYNKEQLTALLTRIGNRVVSTMKPGVDTVILGDDPINEAGDGFARVEESDEYKKAIALGVEFANLRKVRDLIKL